ncbi:MAG: anaerobic ribonucleoside-triphosphate reductase activating protein [Patescibacteria group bacterium]
MKIAGIQKLSLIDYPGKVASVIFTQGCVFRCAYCHNPELIPVTSPLLMREEDVMVVLERQAGFVDGVCITGGEPTLQHDLPEFTARVRALGYSIKLDTNGVHPSMLALMLAEGLIDYVAMDLKHTWAGYARVTSTTSEAAIKNCQRSFALIQASGIPHEFRTTLLPGEHQLETLEQMCGYLKDGESYVVQQFRAGHTLDASLRADPAQQAAAFAAQLREQFPALHISAR